MFLWVFLGSSQREGPHEQQWKRMKGQRLQGQVLQTPSSLRGREEIVSNKFCCFPYLLDMNRDPLSR